MSNFIMETSRTNLTDFDSNMNYNYSITSVNRGYGKVHNESVVEKKFNQFRKLYQSLEDIESNLGELNRQNRRAMHDEDIQPVNLRSESCDYTKERNPFYSSSTKSVKFKDMDFSTAQSSENLVKEIDDLKSKIKDLRDTNSVIKSNKSYLQNQIDDLHNNMSHSLRKSGAITSSFERIDGQFFEINRILTDLNESKALLKKTQIKQRDKYESDSNQTFRHDAQIIHTKNPILFTVNLESESQKFKDNSKFDVLLNDLERIRQENLHLKSKLNDHEFKNDRDFIKSIESSVLVESSQLFETEVFKTNVSRLSDENSKLKLELESLKEMNKIEIDRIRNEFMMLRDTHLNEIKLKSKTNRDLQSEVYDLKIKLKNEQTLKEEIKMSCINEMNAAKCRFEQELKNQKYSIQSKYDDLVKEIENLNLIIKKLQEDKNDLLGYIKREKAKNKSVQKMTTTTKLSQNKYTKMTSSVSDFSETRTQKTETIPIETSNETKKSALHSSTIIYDTSNHSRNLPVKYVSSYHVSPTSKTIRTSID